MSECNRNIRNLKMGAGIKFDGTLIARLLTIMDEYEATGNKALALNTLTEYKELYEHRYTITQYRTVAKFYAMLLDEIETCEFIINEVG